MYQGTRIRNFALALITNNHLEKLMLMSLDQKITSHAVCGNYKFTNKKQT